MSEYQYGTAAEIKRRRLNAYSAEAHAADAEAARCDALIHEAKLSPANKQHMERLSVMYRAVAAALREMAAKVAVDPGALP